MIVVVGADNTGKTTLVKHLMKKFDLPDVPRYHTLPPTDYVDWFKWVRDSMLAPGELVADRFFVDEFVYGPIKRGEIGLTGQKMKYLEDLFETNRPLIILCQTDIETIKATFGDREQYPELAEIEPIMEKFREVLADTDLPFHKCPQMIWNFKKDGKFALVDLVVNTYLKAREWTNEC